VLPNQSDGWKALCDAPCCVDKLKKRAKLRIWDYSTA
jgi:hypothetical protein